MKFTFILGTRPEIIKIAPLIRECQKRGLPFSIIHTNQHYSSFMDSIFFADLNLPKPDYNLHVGSGTHAAQTAKMMTRIENILKNDIPGIILAQGDTNTVLAAALVASKLHIPFGHIEAGLRSGDRSMPEEINRIIADHCADLLFAPTIGAYHLLVKTGVEKNKVCWSGNTVVDAVKQHKKIALEGSKILQNLNLKKKQFFLLTIHRQENVDNKTRLISIFKGIEQVIHTYSTPVIFPAHPRTIKMLKKFGITIPPGVKVVKPVGYLDFLVLLTHARAVLTDSGGVQEEACILHTPCVTLRDSTERPETLRVKSNILVGVESRQILLGVNKMLLQKNNWKQPFGNGKSAAKIINFICKNY